MKYINIEYKASQDTPALDEYSYVDSLCSTIRIVNTICSICNDLSEERIDEMVKIADQILRLLLNAQPIKFGEKYLIIASFSLRIVNHVMHHKPAWIQEQDNLSVVIGCFKTFISSDTNIYTPTKAVPSAQLVPEDQKNPIALCKPDKSKKKPRVRDNLKKHIQNKQDVNKYESHTLCYVISDSEHSEVENRSRDTALQTSKLHGHAISLVITITQVLYLELIVIINEI